jgi:hypothetical protein
MPCPSGDLLILTLQPGLEGVDVLTLAGAVLADAKLAEAKLAEAVLVEAVLGLLACLITLPSLSRSVSRMLLRALLVTTGFNKLRRRRAASPSEARDPDCQIGEGP